MGGVAKIPSITRHVEADDMANAVAGAIWLVSEHGGQFFLPEAYGIEFRANGIPGRHNDHPATERFW